MLKHKIYQLHDAIMNHYNGLAVHLLESGIDKDSRYEDGSTPIMWAARYANLEMVQKLIQLGADLNAKDNIGYDAINIAYWYGEYRMGAYTPVSLKIAQLLKEARIQAENYQHTHNILKREVL